MNSFDAPFDGDLSAELDLALRLADAADAVSMARFDAADLDIRVKPDATHVTEADLATERAIRDILEAERPSDGIFGEEFGSSGDAARQWIIEFGEEYLEDKVDYTSHMKQSGRIKSSQSGFLKKAVEDDYKTEVRA